MIKIKFILFIFLLTSFVKTYAFTPADTIVLKRKKIHDFKGKIFDAPIVLKTNPISFLLNNAYPILNKDIALTAEYRLMVEITTARTQSDQASFSLIGKSVLWKVVENAAGISALDSLRISGWRVTYAHKFYLLTRRRHAPSGFYFGPFLSYTDTHVAVGLTRYYNHTYFDFRTFSANLMIGVQAAHINRVTFEVYAAAGYKSNKVFYHATSSHFGQIDTKDFNDLYKTNLNAAFGINMGYAF